MATLKQQPVRTRKYTSRSTARFPTGASRFPSTAKTKSEFTKMLGTATPAKRKSLQAQFKSINGTSWRGTATKFPTQSDFNRKAAAAGVKKGTPRKKTRANTAEIRKTMASARRSTSSSGTRKPSATKVSSVRYVRGANGTARKVSGTAGRKRVPRGRNLSPGTPRGSYSSYMRNPQSFTSATAARKRLNTSSRKRKTGTRKRK